MQWAVWYLLQDQQGAVFRAGQWLSRAIADTEWRPMGSSIRELPAGTLGARTSPVYPLDRGPLRTRDKSCVPLRPHWVLSLPSALPKACPGPG